MTVDFETYQKFWCELQSYCIWRPVNLRHITLQLSSDNIQTQKLDSAQEKKFLFKKFSSYRFFRFNVTKLFKTFNPTEHSRTCDEILPLTFGIKQKVQFL